MEPKDVSGWVTAAKGALDLMRSSWQLLPRGDKKDELEANVRKAEEALQISSVSLAKSLGYKLCKCTFPPQIMLWNKEKRTNICSLCGNEDPPQPTFHMPHWVPPDERCQKIFRPAISPCERAP
jgi:hypothetical protein